MKKEYKKSGNYICFGSYPQTKVTDNDLIASLKQLNKTTDLKDIIYNNEKYRYYDNNFYKFEPIKWQILEEKNGKAIILSDLILDSKMFDKESNNYEKSYIRAWLNDTFYNTAFTELQQAIINTVEVDNSKETTAIGRKNKCVCSNTFDKVWLLSYQEAFELDWLKSDEERQKSGTDYAKCQGLYVYSSGCSYWWLRSPFSYSSYSALNVSFDGYCCYWIVCDTGIGVVPTLTITL